MRRLASLISTRPVRACCLLLPAAPCCYCLLLRACGLLLLRVDACGKWRASLCLTQISTFVATTDFHRQAISCGADGRIVLWKTPQ
jgi:hypothetical protein